MTLSEVQIALQDLSHITFELPNGNLVPAHFHVTEVGKVTKEFIDCGGTIRKESVVNFQLWSANDVDHRLHPQKLRDIIELSERKLGIDNAEVEVEYQAETIGKFGLEFSGNRFKLTTKQTDCLAKDNCGIPVAKPKVRLAEIQSANACAQGSGCC
tara:strand:- start:423 stop:890 length:468 start_codon:yes stop_codon:yes gene_type:complete